jgi:hypothetical protein
MAAVVLAGSVQPAWAADNPPVNLTDTQWANILIGSGMRIKDSGADLDKDTIASAELLDWRTLNPAADTRSVLVHLGTLRSAMSSQLTVEQAQQPHAEVLRRLLTIVYGIPGSAITGTHMTQLLAAVTGRDLAQAMKTEEQRLTGVQQDLDVDVKYDEFQSQVWAGVRATAAADTTFATMWRQQIGAAAGSQPLSVDPTASVDALKVMPVFKDMVDVDALKAQGALGTTQFVAETVRQTAPLQTKIDATSTQLTDALKASTTTKPAPGDKITPPSQGAVDQSKKDVDDRQKVIDQAKAGLDFAASALKYVAPGAGAKLATYIDTVYKLATQANKLIGAVETLGAATSIGAAFGGVGAVVGAAVGIVQILGSLLSSGGSDQAAQDQIKQAIDNGFKAVQHSLQTIFETMNSRFDRIDSSLGQIYTDMQNGFNQLYNAVEKVDVDVSVVHDQLLTLQTELDSFGEVVLDGLRDTEKDPFLLEVGHYVDYPLFNNGASIPTSAQYVEAASNFYTTATSTASNGTFVAQQYRNDDPNSVLGKWGTAGSIDWLASYANNHLGTGFAVPPAGSNTPNMDLWAEGARAYYLTALQNPGYASSTEGAGQVRANSLATTGKGINLVTTQFSTPDAAAPDKINALFKNLNTNYLSTLNQFASDVGQLAYQQPVMAPNRPFNLWFHWDPRYNVNYAISQDQINQLPGPPALSPQCGTSSYNQVSTPSFVDGHDIGNMNFGRWIDPSWTLSSCYTNARLEKVQFPSQCRTPTDCTNSYGVRLYATFQEWVGGMDGGPYQSDTVPVIKLFNGCYWGGPATAPPPASCNTPTINPDLSQALANTWSFDIDRNGDFTVPVPAADPVGKLLVDRRAKYFNLVENALANNTIPSAVQLNTTTRLYQAYTDLGFPRALLNDDQLHALVFGTHSLVANTPGGPGGVSIPILTAAYHQAADLERQQGLDATLPLPVFDGTDVGGSPLNCSTYMDWTNDPVAGCLKAVGTQRAGQLSSTIGSHFQAIATGAETETSPLVDEAVADLTMAGQFAAANFTAPPGPAASPRNRGPR